MRDETLPFLPEEFLYEVIPSAKNQYEIVSQLLIPAVEGLFAKPTIINNVETLSNVPQIIINGADWFAGIGTEKSHGTKVFALGGKINNTGLVEVPMGTTLREIIYEIGGGIPTGKKFKAVQTGGPSGGCIDVYKRQSTDWATLRRCSTRSKPVRSTTTSSRS